MLREFQPLTVFATTLVRRTLESISLFRMLNRVPNQLTWVEIAPGRTFRLNEQVRCTPIPISGSLPYYASELDVKEPDVIEPGQAVLGLLLESDGCRLAYTPSVPEVTDALRTIYDSCDVILVDGTFWSDTDLSRIQPAAPLARSIGHLPMNGVDGTIAKLANITARQKIFIHINNTNPVLDSRSTEYKSVSDAGWQIGQDGWQLN
jgi:pyrroloquinoline quinone biosynthesis protein B